MSVTLSRTRPPTLPLPADAYDPHPYIDNEFGACLGCGHDRPALCHLDPKDPDRDRPNRRDD